MRCSLSCGEDSLRNKKTVNGTVTDYYWLNGVLLGQKTGNEHILFLYDENGSAYGMLLKNGTTEEYYYYIFNAQGDVIGIVDSAGNKVVEYTYSPWGEILSVTGTKADTIGQANPLRYRGYYYDNETGFYYLQSRYYDPVVQRFISADGYVSTGQGILGNNMFAYCENDPVNRVDPSGQKWLKNLWKNIKKTAKKLAQNFVKDYNLSSKKKAKTSKKQTLTINDFKNSDNSYSLYDNRRHNPYSEFHEQLIVFDGDVGTDLLDEGVFVEASATLITGGWEFDKLDLSLMDVGQANLAVGYQDGGVNLTAMASVWSPSMTIMLWDVCIVVSGHVGSAGVEYKLGEGHFNIGASWGWGASLSFNW